MTPFCSAWRLLSRPARHPPAAHGPRLPGRLRHAQDPSLPEHSTYYTSVNARQHCRNGWVWHNPDSPIAVDQRFCLPCRPLPPIPRRAGAAARRSGRPSEPPRANRSSRRKCRARRGSRTPSRTASRPRPTRSAASPRPPILHPTRDARPRRRSARSRRPRVIGKKSGGGLPKGRMSSLDGRPSSQPAGLDARLEPPALRVPLKLKATPAPAGPRRLADVC
jgi:hypothetical protein